MPRMESITSWWIWAKASTIIYQRKAYLTGVNTRHVKRALVWLFEGVVSKDMVSHGRRKVKVDPDE